MCVSISLKNFNDFVLSILNKFACLNKFLNFEQVYLFVQQVEGFVYIVERHFYIEPPFGYAFIHVRKSTIIHLYHLQLHASASLLNLLVEYFVQ